MIPPLLDLPGRDEARRAAQRELSRHEYAEAQPPLLQRLATWLAHRLDELVQKAGDHLPGGSFGLLLLVLLLALGVAVVVVRLRPRRRQGVAQELFGAGAELDADAHRALAEQAAARGEYAVAVRERLRAVVRELESRGALDPRPSRTADEVAADAARVLPGLAGPLRAGARTFDEVWYGGREAQLPAYRELVELDEQVRATQAVRA